MSLSGLLIFAGVYFLAVALPGPGVAAVIAHSLSRGTHGAVAFIAGFLIGDLVWFTFAATGLAALAKTAYAVFVVVKYAGVAYLLYLAYRLWTASVAAAGEKDGEVKDAGQSSWRLFLGTLALTMGNPKTMIFFLALLPTVVKLETLSVARLPGDRGDYLLRSAAGTGRLRTGGSARSKNVSQPACRAQSQSRHRRCNGWRCGPDSNALSAG